MAGPRIGVSSVLGSADGRLIARILSAWLSLDKTLSVRFRLYGWQIEYNSNEIELFCYEATDRAECFLQVSLFAKSLAEAKIFLGKLKKECKDAQVDSQIDYVEEDEDGQELSEEFHIEDDDGLGVVTSDR